MNKKYQIIYADPPWSYRDYTSREAAEKNLNNNSKKSVAMKYDLMTTQEIGELQVELIAAENCILFLWVTMPKLNECFEIIKKWGFRYSTCGFVWIKKIRRQIKLIFGAWVAGREATRKFV